MSNKPDSKPSSKQGQRAPSLCLAALGVVFGDIGTSPLYTFKTILGISGASSHEAVLGALSLVLWTLFIVTTLKYISFAMRIANDGEGGILALMSLLTAKKGHRRVIAAIGVFGAALIYGDGAITPAISVLSAVEGLKTATPVFQPYILPIAAFILVALFALQPLGTARIGKAFGPAMLAWFVTIAAMGAAGLARHPSVLVAIDPRYGLAYLFSHGFSGLLVLSGVFLCVTGSEALYADMGHFGAAPIRISWFAIVFPALVLNYAGQAAFAIDGGSTGDNIFYALCPTALLIPMVVLATIATIVASQSIITGAYSMTRQAIRLGWLPRLTIKQTSPEGYGQIYVAAVNWSLMVATIGLTLAFKTSDHLASAYGVAVSMTMLMTSALLFIAMREIWNWSWPLAASVAGFFFLFDAAFFITNLSKVADGGYVPLLLAALIYAAMWIWRRGADIVAHRVQQSSMPIDEFVALIEERKMPRPSGTAVFLTRETPGAPPMMVWYANTIRALHRHVLILTVTILPAPWNRDGNRIVIRELGPNFWRAEARCGFMETPDIPALLREGASSGCTVDLSDVTYFVGHETIVRERHRRGFAAFEHSLFAAMARNANHASDSLNLPRESVVEIGRQVAG